jgi:hypothetical protein
MISRVINMDDNIDGDKCRGVPPWKGKVMMRLACTTDKRCGSILKRGERIEVLYK